MRTSPSIGCTVAVLFALGRFTIPEVLADPAPTTTDAPIGWASEGDGTKGGAGGPTIEVSDADALEVHLASTDPKTILVKGTIELDHPVRVPSQTSLIGVRADAKLVGGGIHIRKANDVVVRNLTITDAPDAIGIEESHHVWIDHCDLSNCKDGLIDVKRGSDFVTISWNHLHDHHKSCLLGHSDKASIRELDTGHLRVTYHHNFFDGTSTRHPRVRYADPVHVFNNLYRGNEYGVASVMDAGVIVEGNVFEDVEQPTLTAYGDSPDPGRLIERHNLYVRSGPPQSRGAVDEKRLTYEYELDATPDVAARVTKGAGVGRPLAPPAK